MISDAESPEREFYEQFLWCTIGQIPSQSELNNMNLSFKKAEKRDKVKLGPIVADALPTIAKSKATGADMVVYRYTAEVIQ